MSLSSLEATRMNRIKEVRKKQGYSQQSLAIKLNVNQTAISQWERGTTTPSASLLKQLSKLFNVSTDYLLGISDDYHTYSWQDTDIMSEVKNNLDPIIKNIFQSIKESDDQTQKLIFDILIEFQSILNIPNKSIKNMTIDLLHQNIYGMNNVAKRALKDK